MADFNAVAKEIFTIIREYDYTVRLYDADSMTVTEPEKARRFVLYPRNLQVALDDDDDNSRISLTLGPSTHIDDVMGLDQNLRTLATKYNLMFQAQQRGKVIDPKHFARTAAITEDEDNEMQVCEGLYGTSHSSYLRRDHARMIVRHSARIDDRTRDRCVESVTVEDTLGRRHRLPTGDLWVGRAITEHLNRGGTMTDETARQVLALAKEQHQISRALDHVAAHAISLREACEARLSKLRETLQRVIAGKMIPKTARIDEAGWPDVRPMLRGRHSPEVYAACARVLAEQGRASMVHVAGHAIAPDTWASLAAGDIALRVKPSNSLALPAKLSEVASVLHEVARGAVDRGMSRMLETVADRLVDPAASGQRGDDKNIAMMALRAAGVIEPPLAHRHAAVAEHVAWLDQFDPERILKEAGVNDPMNPYFDHDLYDRAADEAIAQFDADEFADSPEMQDVIGGRNPQDPEENMLTKDEVMGALRAYLQNFVEQHNPDMEEYNDASSLTDAVYEPAIEALQHRGFVVTDGGLEESRRGDEDTLTIEDVLLPKNKSSDLGQEVTKGNVTQPDHDGETKRLMTLAGLE